MVRLYILCFSILLVNLLLLQNVNGTDDEEGEMCPCIVLSITEDSFACPDYENKDITAELKMNIIEGDDDTPDMMSMNGFCELKKDAGEDIQIEIKALLQTEVGEDPVFACTSDMCKSMSDTDTPWYPLLEKMNVTGCPIAAAYYPIKGLHLNLDFANGVLDSNFCGDYNLLFQLSTGIDTIFCIMLGARIYEVQLLCSECPNPE